MKRAIIYLRVSTNRQVDGASLETQEMMCQQWASRYDVIIDKIFHDDGYSAKTLNRPAMKELLAYAETNRNKLDYLITYQTDRLTRNSSDYFALVTKLSSWGLTYKNVNSSIESNHNEELINSIEAVLAQHDNKIKSERVSQNMKRHALDGYRMGMAPYGLRNTRNALGRSTVTPIKETEAQLTQVLLAYSTGGHSIKTIVEMAQNLGLKTKSNNPMTFQLMSKILRQPLYAGLECNAHTEGQLVKSSFKGLISEGIYFRNQELLSNNKNSSSKYTQSNPLFPLRKFIKCYNCKSSLRASSPTNGSGKSSPRYHCTSKGCGSSIVPEELHSQFMDLLSSVELNESKQSRLRRLITKVWRQELSNINKMEKSLHRDLEKLRVDKNKGLSKFIDGEISIDEKNSFISDLDTRILFVKRTLEETRNITSLKEDAILYCVRSIGNAPAIWNKADLDHKIIFQNLMFPNGLEYDLMNKKFGTVKLNVLYRLAEQIKNPSLNDESLMVTSRRIELRLPG